MPVYGLDFGTTTTYLTNGTTGTVVAIPLGTAEEGKIGSDDGNALLSRVRNDDGKLVVGTKYGVRSLKSMIYSGPKDGLTEKQRDDYIEAIFRNVIDTAKLAKIDLKEPGTVRLGVPAFWELKHREKLIEIAKKAGLGLFHDSLVEEPVAAGLAWVQSNKEIACEQGLTLVFDMGGGTLDVAVLDVKAVPQSATGTKIFVLSTLGNNYAGDKIDEKLLEIAKKKLSQTKTTDEGYALTSLEDIKKIFSSSESEKNQKLALVQGDRDSVVEITRKDIELATQPAIEEALATVELSLKYAYLWDLVRYSGIGPKGQVPGNEGKFYEPKFTGMLINEVKTVPFPELAASVSSVVLAGGMSNSIEIQNSLKKIFTKATFFYGDSTKPNNRGFESARIIGSGLGYEKQYESLNFSRPNYEIRVGGKVQHEAFERLLSPQLIKDSAPVLRNRKPLAHGGLIEISRFASNDKEPLLDLNGNKVVIDHGADDPRTITYPDGTLVIFDGTGRRLETSFRAYLLAGFSPRSASDVGSQFGGGTYWDENNWRVGSPRDVSMIHADRLYPENACLIEIQQHLQFRETLAMYWSGLNYLKEYIETIKEILGQAKSNPKYGPSTQEFLGSLNHGSSGHKSCQSAWYAFWITSICQLGWYTNSYELSDQLRRMTDSQPFRDWSSKWFDEGQFQASLA